MTKQLSLFKIKVLGLFLLLVIAGCDSKLKEHPLPPELKRQLEMKNDPALQAKAISGTISIDPKVVSDSTANSSTLFIFLRNKGVEGGPPLAVKRLSDIKYPYNYQIGPWDSMIQGTQFDGELTLTARIDSDGDAKASPGDIDGTLTVMPGDKKADLLLSHVIPGTAVRNKSVSGVITADPTIVTSAVMAESPVIFVFARPKGAQGGPPLAVQRLTEVRFPYEYKIGQSDVMVPGTQFDGEMVVTVRIDRDSNAKASSGDIEGSTETVAGAEKANIVLNRVIP